METEIKVIGNQYSQYGSSTFFKGLRITKSESSRNKCSVKNTSDNGDADEKKHETESTSKTSKSLIIAMGDCIPVRPWHDSPVECLAEVRMIWRDKTEQTLLLSLRLYVLPENSPKGRVGHGEDELVAVKDLDSPKGRIIIRAEDFSTWLSEDLRWNWGLTASFYDQPTVKLVSSSSGIPVTSLLSNSNLDFSEVENEKEKDGSLHSNVTVLSYSRYCRYRATLKRLQHIEDNQIRIKLLETLSGFVASQPNTRIMFAKEAIDFPDLESHEMLCPHLAPKLIGRPRGRRKKNTTSRISECSSPAPSSEFSVDSCETNDSDVFDGKHLIKNKDLLKNNHRLTRNKRKSDSVHPEIYTTLSTGRVSKQRLPLTPIKSSTNKRKRKADVSDDDDQSSSDDDQEDEDYGEKHVRKSKQALKRQSSSKDEDEDVKHNPHLMSNLMPALQIPMDSSKAPEEVDFLIRLNTFMAERAYAYPKLVWGLRDVNLYTIYMRVQKLGGFDAIADNRVWKNLFEDLSEPGKACITQGMTKRKYERILLPFERYERELRENGKYVTSELTISTISKNNLDKFNSNNSRMQMKRRNSSSPAIEIIPLKNGAAENVELTLEQINEIQNIIKPKDYDAHQYYNGSDGDTVPVHVIVRPNANGASMADFNNKKKLFGRYDDFDKLPGSSRSSKATATGGGGQQKPKEKENIPLMLQNHTTIVPLTRDGIPTFSQPNVVELIDSDDDGEYQRGSGSNQNTKKRKLDILREGGLEVTPISRRAQADLQITLPPTISTRPSQQIMQPNVSLMSLSPVRAPPVIQSLNMYQSTRQVFKNPKDDVINAARSAKLYCLDLTSKKQQQQQQYQQQQAADMSRDHRKSQLSIEEVQRNYRGSNPDLQITLVKPHQEAPSSSSSGYKLPNGHNQQKPRSSLPQRKPKNVPSQSQLPGLPPLNPVIIAAANELQKMQQHQQNMPMFPFLSGLDITPMHQQPSSSASPKNSSPPAPQLDPSIMQYLSALYGNPLLQGSNMLSNMSPAVEFLKLYNQSATNNRIPSSKN